MATIPVRHIHTNLSNVDASDPVRVRKLDELLATQDMVQPLHRHSFYFILVVDKGSGRHTIDFTPYPVGDGDVFIVRPGQVHELQLAQYGKGFLIQFSDELFIHTNNQTAQILKTVSRTNYYPTKPENRDRIASFMDAMAREAAQKRPLYQQAIQLTLHLLLIELLRQPTNAPLSADTARTYNQERLEAFQDLVATHFAHHEPVSWYAHQLHLSLYQLNAIAKAKVNKTASAVINEYILLEAKRHLLATANQISQIAWDLGYEDVAYFIRFFKKHTGQTPEAFRMKFK